MRASYVATKIDVLEHTACTSFTVRTVATKPAQARTVLHDCTSSVCINVFSVLKSILFLVWSIGVTEQP